MISINLHHTSEMSGSTLTYSGFSCSLTALQFLLLVIFNINLGRKSSKFQSIFKWKYEYYLNSLYDLFI